ncbi:MAG: SpoIIE family protein phosphatase, partial [Candidatus Riflebacteria bacterium]|nr:SpoIIE family protein phosphatase [Candidatus Riflebacteria bacterium]
HEVQSLLNNGKRVDALPPGNEKKQAELWFNDDKPVVESFLKKIKQEFNLYAAFVIQHAGPGYYNQISVVSIDESDEISESLTEMIDAALYHDPSQEQAIISRATIKTGRSEFRIDSPAPLVFSCQAGGETYGHLGIAISTHQLHRRISHRSKLMPMLANQLGLYFSHFYQLRKEAVHGRMLQQINQTCNTINSSVDIGAILFKLVESLNYLFGQYSGAILIFSRETSELEIVNYLGGAIPDSFNLAELITARGPVTEAINEGAAFDNRSGNYDLPIRYVLPLATTPQATAITSEFMPLRSLGGVVLFNSPINKPLSEEDLTKLMPILLNGISASLQVACNYAEKLDTIRALEGLMARLADTDALLDEMLIIIRRLLKVNRISFLELDASGKFLRIKKGFGLPPGIIDKTNIPIGEEISGYVAQQGRSYRIDNIESEGVFKKRSLEHYLNRSLLSVPLINSRGAAGRRVIGVINVNNKTNGLTFTMQDQQLLEAIAHLVVTALENVRFLEEQHEKNLLERQLKDAKDIQMSLLPKNFSNLPANLEVFGQSIPARQIGGDFFDIFSLNDGRMLAVLGDVSGKGMPAAILMAVTRMIIWSVVQDCVDPVEIIEKVNDKLCSHLDSYHFVTMQLVAIDPQTGHCEMSSAGHGPLLVRLHAQCRLIETKSGPPLGIAGIKGVYHNTPFVMNQGDAFIMYTDGLSEERSPSGEMYGSERISYLLGSNPDQSAEELVKTMISTVENWRGNAEAHDDLTVFTLNYKGPAI